MILNWPKLQKFVAIFNIAHKADYERDFKRQGGWRAKFGKILQEVKNNKDSEQFCDMLKNWGGVT